VWKALSDDEIKKEQVKIAVMTGEQKSRRGELQISFMYKNTDKGKAKRRWIELKWGFVFTYRQESDLIPAEMLPLRGATLTAKKANLSKFKFEVSRPNDPTNAETPTWIFIAKDQMELQKWMDAVNGEIAREDMGLDLFLVQEIHSPGGISMLAQVRGTIWVCGDGWISVYSTENFPATVQNSIDIKEQIAPFTTDKFTLVSAILDYGGFVWICVSKNVYCYDIETATIVGVLQGHRNKVTAIVGYQDKLWTTAEGTVMVWSTAPKANKQFECMKTLETGGKKLMALASFGGKVWSAGFSKELFAWNAETYEVVTHLHSLHTDTLTAFVPFLNTVWVGSEDGSISIWK